MAKSMAFAATALYGLSHGVPLQEDPANLMATMPPGTHPMHIHQSGSFGGSPPEFSTRMNSFGKPPVNEFTDTLTFNEVGEVWKWPPNDDEPECVRETRQDLNLNCGDPSQSLNKEWGTIGCPWETTHPEGASIGFVHIGKAGGTTVQNVFSELFKQKHIHDNDAYVPSEFWTMHNRQGTEGKWGLAYPKWDLLVINVRDPAERLISAFNFFLRDPTMSKFPPAAMMQPPPGAALLDECFPAPNQWESGHKPGGADLFARAASMPTSSVNHTCVLAAHALTDDRIIKAAASGEAPWAEFVHRVGHMTKGLSWYLAYPHGGTPSIMHQISTKKGPKVFLVRSETFEDDMADLMDWLCVKASVKSSLLKLPAINYDTVFANTRHTDSFLGMMTRTKLMWRLRSEYDVLDRLEHLAENGKFYNRSEAVGRWGDDRTPG
jgi:hypothetical protein